ncbi:MAG: Omp28-related outer membrane protein [Flavobacteriales bacterium]|nr:Omp28-related outer membrane protein [Flavobacteriales bacterium]
MNNGSLLGLRSLVHSLLVAAPLFASGQVSQEPQNRNVLLEEFTAINCGNCPVGHVAANSIMAANPTNVVLVNMHAGPLATPSGSQPDFRDTWSTQLLTEFGVGFTPQGLVNRRAYNGTTLLGSSAWTNATNATLALPAVVNMAATTEFDNGTRQLAVTVELYYTADSPGANDRIFVLLTEDHLNGYQQNYGAGGASANYDHRHVMRAYITAINGDEVATNTVGSTTTRTYTYSVPLSYDINACRVVAFVGEGAGSGYGEVHQVTTAQAIPDVTGVEETMLTDVGSAFPVPATDVVTVPLTAVAEARELRISDTAGRIVKREVVRGEVASVSIGVADLQPGIYFYGFPDGPAKRLVVVR